MAVFKVIPPGDLVLSAPDPSRNNKRRIMLVTGPAYVRQKIQTRLKFLEGEWFNDLRQGIPYTTEIFVQNPNLDRIRSIIRQAILSVQEVASLTSLTLLFAKNTRAISVAFEAQLVTGGVLSIRQPDPPFIITLPRTL